MTISVKMLTAMSIAALVAACQAGGNDRVDTIGEIEATTDTAIQGDTVPGPGGSQVAP